MMDPGMAIGIEVDPSGSIQLNQDGSDRMD